VDDQTETKNSNEKAPDVVLASLLEASQNEQNRLEAALLEKTKECETLRANLENKVTPEETEKLESIKTKSRLGLIFGSVIALNITSVISVVLFIGVRKGVLPDAGPLKSLFDFALELSKVIWNT
jgi:hypothetical protein